MGWASGVYTRIFGSSGWQADKAALIKILASRHDSHDQDISDGLNTLRTELRGESLTSSNKVLTAVAGTNTITASLTSATPAGTLTAYSSGLAVTFTPANSNTGATTININSLGALDVMNTAGGACTGGELIAGVAYTLLLDAGGDDWIILNAAKPPESITPTWSGTHTYTASGAGLSSSAIVLLSALPVVYWKETDGAADNKVWRMYANGERFFGDVQNDADSVATTWVVVDRTGTTVDSVAFPTQTANSFLIGTPGSTTYVGAVPFKVRTTTANSGAGVFVSPTAASTTLTIHNEATAGDNSLIAFSTEGGTGTSRGSITYNRGGGVVAYNTTSDRRLKDNIRDSPGALSLILQIKVRAFEWKNMPGSAQRYWLVAQEVFDVMPEAVTVPEKEEGLWSLDCSKLGPLTIKGMQEQQAEIEDLRTSLQTLLTRVASLERAAGVSKT